MECLIECLLYYFISSGRFFVYGKNRDVRTSSCGANRQQTDDVTHENSLSAVVYGLVQSRKKQSLGSSLSVPSPSKQRSGPRGLSVSFSLRKKSKRHTPTQKLHRMHSENPNIIQKRRQGIESPSSGFNETMGQRRFSHTMAAAAHPASSHSSPDVRQDDSLSYPRNDDPSSTER